MFTKTVIANLQKQADLMEDLIQYENVENLLERTFYDFKRTRMRMYMAAWEQLEVIVMNKAAHLINHRGDNWDIR
jgi:hypothetical protein